MPQNSHGKLIVENFGPIKRAEIDLNQLMIFIGPQGSGKSTLLKLMAAFYHFNSEHIDYLKLPSPWKDDLTYIFKNGALKKYQLESFFRKNTYLLCDSFWFKWEYKNNELKSLLKIRRKKWASPFDVYVPAERNFFSIYTKVTQSLINERIPIPESMSAFGSFWETARERLRNQKIDFLKIEYRFEDGKDLIKYNSSTMNMENSASGFQSVVPMYLVIELISGFNTQRDKIPYKNYLNLIDKRITGRPININEKTIDITHAVFIEEPELNLFPLAQKALVEFLTSRLIQFHQRPHNLIISTHSPYILTSLDNLIQAGNVFKQNPKLKTQINEIIPESSWIGFDKTSAYFVENGRVKNILNKKNRIIDGNKIDKVSEEIAIDFDKLLDLQFSK